MSANEFEFKYGDTTVYTGMQTPEAFPLSFTPYPEKKIRSVEEINEIIDYPGRIPARSRWGKETILNQGQRSSCNAYMAAAIWMRSNFLATGVWVDVSPEFLYMHINGGRDQGSMLDDGMVFMTDNGMCKKDLVPYQAYRKSELSMEALRFATQDALNQRAGECYRMPTDSVEKCWASLVSCLAGRGQVGLAVHVGNNYMRSGTMAGVDRGNGNHAIAGDDLVKLNNNPRSYEDFAIDSPQSWGTGFADGGRTLITIKSIEQTYRVHALYGVRSVLTNPNELSETRIR